MKNTGKNTMKKTNKYRDVATLAALLLASAALTGCPPMRHGEAFYNDDAVRSTGRMAEAQCASGAKADAMLYDMNFHGDKLNTLGEGKLDLILKGTHDGDPVTVYLNMPHDQVAPRQVEVVAYLKSVGLSDSRIVVAEGPNPNNTTPTAYNLGKIYKQDNGSFDGQAAKDETTAAPGPGMAAGH